MRWPRGWGARRGAGRWIGFGSVPIVGVVLLLALPPAGAFHPPLTPSFTAGCQGQSTGAKIFSQSGTTGRGTYTASNSNGVSDGSSYARSPRSSSAIDAGAYYFVGPSSSGCSSPSTTTGGLRATFIWNVSWTPYLSVNCSGDQSAAIAEYQMYALGNVHWASSPYYLFIPHVHSHTYQYMVDCHGVGSSTYSPGTFGPITLKFNSTTFTESSGVSYDYYSSIWGQDETRATPGSTAYSSIAINATLEEISCPLCP
ncbi:MAG TPA: hypothetical protein VMH78_02880 [Thermoplasmata archaeon]|nr:hypothetical protein [Thermoplasmata archaeon]